MKLIIADGQPGTGKTTLATRLAKETGLVMVNKDTIKEFLFGMLGTYDEPWTRMIGASASDIMMRIADGILGYGKSMILESPLHRDYARIDIERMQTKHPELEIIEIHCEAEPIVRKQRYIQRNESGQRHKGYFDHTYYDLDEETLRRYEPVGIGALIRVDTTMSIGVYYIIYSCIFQWWEYGRWALREY